MFYSKISFSLKNLYAFSRIFLSLVLFSLTPAVGSLPVPQGGIEKVVSHISRVFGISKFSTMHLLNEAYKLSRRTRYDGLTLPRWLSEGFEGDSDLDRAAREEKIFGKRSVDSWGSRDNVYRLSGWGDRSSVAFFYDKLDSLLSTFSVTRYTHHDRVKFRERFSEFLTDALESKISYDELFSKRNSDGETLVHRFLKSLIAELDAVKIVDSCEYSVEHGSFFDKLVSRLNFSLGVIRIAFKLISDDFRVFMWSFATRFGFGDSEVKEEEYMVSDEEKFVNKIRAAHKNLPTVALLPDNSVVDVEKFKENLEFIKSLLELMLEHVDISVADLYGESIDDLITQSYFLVDILFKI